MSIRARLNRIERQIGAAEAPARAATAADFWRWIYGDPVDPDLDWALWDAIFAELSADTEDQP